MIPHSMDRYQQCYLHLLHDVHLECIGIHIDEGWDLALAIAIGALGTGWTSLWLLFIIFDRLVLLVVLAGWGSGAAGSVGGGFLWLGSSACGCGLFAGANLAIGTTVASARWWARSRWWSMNNGGRERLPLSLALDFGCNKLLILVDIAGFCGGILGSWPV